MEIIGGGKMHVYPVADEYPHPPGSDTDWQEGYFLHFWDLQRSVGAFFRIGHEPNYKGGTLALWSWIVTPEGVFRHVDDLALQPGDVFKNGFSGGNGALRYEFDGKRIRWTVREPGVSADLIVEDFHPAVDGYLREGSVSEFSAQHVEVAVRVSGTMTTQGNTYAVDGMGTRDHGWGVRKWDYMLSHRWTVASFDRDNSFCALAMHTSADTFAKFGWVIRGDKVIYADKVDILAYIECDATSNRGGVTRMTLTTGEIFEAHFELIAPCMSSTIHGLVCIDTFARVRWGDRIGEGCFETSANIRRGTHLPAAYDAGTISTNGWHPTQKA